MAQYKEVRFYSRGFRVPCLRQRLLPKQLRKRPRMPRIAPRVPRQPPTAENAITRGKFDRDAEKPRARGSNGRGADAHWTQPRFVSSRALTSIPKCAALLEPRRLNGLAILERINCEKLRKLLPPNNFCTIGWSNSDILRSKWTSRDLLKQENDSNYESDVQTIIEEKNTTG